MPKHGKKYMDSLKAFDKHAVYTVDEAFDLVKAGCKANFDETIDF